MTDARIFPRAAAAFPIEIAIAKGDIISTSMINVSRSGVMVNANHTDFERLLAANKASSLNEPVEVDLQFQLGDGGHAPIAVHARAIYVRRIAQDQYHLGFKFLKLSTQVDSLLKDYVDNNLPGSK